MKRFLVFPLCFLAVLTASVQTHADDSTDCLQVSPLIGPWIERDLLPLIPSHRRLCFDTVDYRGDPSALIPVVRAIRNQGLSTHANQAAVLKGGATWLFLAGKQRTSADEARFFARSWDDGQGHDALEYAAKLPIHKKLITLFAEIDLSEETYWHWIKQATQFEDFEVSDFVRSGLSSSQP